MPFALFNSSGCNARRDLVMKSVINNCVCFFVKNLLLSQWNRWNTFSTQVLVDYNIKFSSKCKTYVDNMCCEEHCFIFGFIKIICLISCFINSATYIILIEFFLYYESVFQLFYIFFSTPLKDWLTNRYAPHYLRISPNSFPIMFYNVSQSPVGMSALKVEIIRWCTD